MRIEETKEGFVLIAEMSTAKEMCLFDRITYEHSEYTTDYAEFKEENNIQCSYPAYDIIGNSVVASILFWNIHKYFKEEHVIKIQKYIQKKMRE
jgi:hypothetical protein